MTLTNEQAAAAHTTKSDVVVIASASSGKTTLITERVKWLLEQNEDPTKIVLITFTNAAAEEMRKRIGEKGKDCFIGTVHSYANQLLLRKGVDTGRLIQNERFDDFFELIKKNEDCIVPVNHLIVDEVQDSDEIQFDFFLDRIKPKNFFFVGDPRQAIYTFRGARPDLLIDLSRRGSTYTYKLTKNYRNGSAILAFAKEKLADGGPWDDSVAMSKIYGTVAKAPYKPEIIAKIIKDNRTKTYKEWFILTRTNAQLEEVYEGLVEAGIPCVTFKRGGMTLDELSEKMEENSVKVLTIHTAKGLEADNVIVIGARGWTEEEKRINYVAATRARKVLIWTHAARKKPTKTMNWET